MFHIQSIFNIPLNNIYAWTDSTLVLNWQVGNPKKFKTYVSNRVSQIVELNSPDRWNHVDGLDNPADCTSKGIFPLQLIDHALWWEGPDWLYQISLEWPIQISISSTGRQMKNVLFHCILLQ